MDMCLLPTLSNMSTKRLYGHLGCAMSQHILKVVPSLILRSSRVRRWDGVGGTFQRLYLGQFCAVRTCAGGRGQAASYAQAGGRHHIA